MCDFNIPGVDHKFPLPALPGKWPWSPPPLPRQSAIPFAEVREQREWREQRRSSIRGDEADRTWAASPTSCATWPAGAPAPRPREPRLNPGGAGSPRGAPVHSRSLYARAQAVPAHIFPSACVPAKLPGDRKGRKTTPLVFLPLLPAFPRPDHLLKEKTLPTDTVTTHPRPHLLRQRGHPRVLGAQGGMLERSAAGTSWAGSSAKRLRAQCPVQDPERGHLRAARTWPPGPSGSRRPRAPPQPRAPAARSSGGGAGDFVYIRARGQARLRARSQAGHHRYRRGGWLGRLARLCAGSSRPPGGLPLPGGRPGLGAAALRAPWPQPARRAVPGWMDLFIYLWPLTCPRPPQPEEAAAAGREVRLASALVGARARRGGRAGRGGAAAAALREPGGRGGRGAAAAQGLGADWACSERLSALETGLCGSGRSTSDFSFDPEGRAKARETGRDAPDPKHFGA